LFRCTQNWRVKFARTPYPISGVTEVQGDDRSIGCPQPLLISRNTLDPPNSFSY
jgi:hypothetical protein